MEPKPVPPSNCDWPLDCPVHRLELWAGDALLFSERLTHSTSPWSGRSDRRTLFFKYVQRQMCWSHGHLTSNRGETYDLHDMDLTEAQRQILALPPKFLNLQEIAGDKRPKGQPPTRGADSPWHPRL